MTFLVGGWSNYATLVGFNYVEGVSVTAAPTSFDCMLTVGSANPDVDTPVEVTDSGYSRLIGISMFNDDSGILFYNLDELDFGPFSGGTAVGGIAILDHGTGNILWFANLPTPVTLPSGTGVVVGPNGFIISEVQ